MPVFDITREASAAHASSTLQANTGGEASGTAGVIA
jgi:hypothetical protein